MSTDDILPEYPFRVTVYGGKKEETFTSIEKHLGIPEESNIYHTWINVSAMKRLRFLFVDGVESAGGIFDVLALFVIIAAILAIFVFWQLVVFFLIIVVLTLFSGGAALKFVRGTFFAAPVEQVRFEGIDDFVKENLALGHFVRIESESTEEELGPLARSSSRATFLFRLGVFQSLVVGTIVLIVEVLYRFLLDAWLVDLVILGIFGLGFLIGALTMDTGVLLRYRLARKVRTR
ncbi:MAG: hypothetical protein RTU92_04165 [Candidatus Thorarchaeota archaeon]